VCPKRQKVKNASASSLHGRDDPPLGVDVERPAGDDRQADVGRRVQDGDFCWRDDLVAGHAVDLRRASDAYLNKVTRPEVVEVAEDVALNIVVAVDDGIAGAERGGEVVAGDSVARRNQHVALRVRAAIVDRRVMDANPHDRHMGHRRSGGRCRGCLLSRSGR